MIKKSWFLCLLLWPICSFYGQKDYKGKIVDSETGKPIPYVNIGIVNKGIGTVSDEEGLFHLELGPELLQSNEVILFSSLGYEPLRIPTPEVEFKYNEYPVLNLTPSIVELNEVVVTNKATELVNELVGYRDYGTVIFGYWKEDTALGGELATRIRVKKGLRRLNSLGFEILVNKMDSILLRVNLYDCDGKLGAPKTNLNTSGKNILHKIKKGDTGVKVDLSPYSIYVEEDFIVSLELVSAYGNKPIVLAMPAISNNSGSFRRYASQDKWERISDSGMGYYLQTSVFVSKVEADKRRQKAEKKKKRMARVFGFVIDRGRMLSGVSVMNLRTKEEVVTNENGRYLIHAKEKDILSFSINGYEKNHYRVGKKSTLNANLKMIEQ
nr:carboxypeptidase-like regulatory domain-containing protein [Allomuricauda sp.]